MKTVEVTLGHNWAIALFEKSVLKQRKLKEITSCLGPLNGARCLDLGSDNGVVSYFLRNHGGRWASADLDSTAVESIRNLVGTDVYQIDGKHLPFKGETFDCVVVVDMLEHVADDQALVDELRRVMKPGGELILNVPHIKNSLLRKCRLAIGQTDERHGHLRHGYTPEDIRQLLGSRFRLDYCRTYSKFFSQLIDTLIQFSYELLNGKRADRGKKGMLVTDQEISKYQKTFKLYSLLYPVVWCVSKLDHLLFFRSGYMMVAKARAVK